MNKQTYLDELKWYLNKNLDVAEQADIITDYSEYFDNGIANGRSEAELCAALGAPEKVANELVNEQTEYTQDSRKFAHKLTAWIIFFVLQIIMAAAIIYPFPQALWAFIIKPVYAVLCPLTAIYLANIDIMVKYSALRTKALKDVHFVGKAALCVLAFTLCLIIASYIVIFRLVNSAMPIIANAALYGSIINYSVTIALFVTATAFAFLIAYAKKLSIYFTCAYFICSGIACTIMDIVYSLANFTGFSNIYIHLLFTLIPIIAAVIIAILWYNIIKRKLAKAVITCE